MSDYKFGYEEREQLILAYNEGRLKDARTIAQKLFESLLSDGLEPEQAHAICNLVQSGAQKIAADRKRKERVLWA